MILFADEKRNNRRFEEKSLEKKKTSRGQQFLQGISMGVNHFIGKKEREKKKGFLITDSHNHHYPTNYSSD